MTRYNEDDQTSTQSRIDQLVKAVDDAERSAIAVKGTHETTDHEPENTSKQDNPNSESESSFLDKPIEERWPSADNAAKIGGEVIEKEDDPAPTIVIDHTTDEEDFSLEENSNELIKTLDQAQENNYWKKMAEVNETLRKLDSTPKTGTLTEYVSGEASSEDFGFGRFNSVTGRVVEHYITELANELDLSGGQYRFGEDNGAVKTSIGYTLGAKPDAGDYSFTGLDDIPEENLEDIGEVIGTVTESKVRDDKKSGKYMEAFQLYAETDMNQKEIAEQTELDPASMSRRKQVWEESGLVENGEYTAAGEIMSEMIDQIYEVK